MLDGKLTVLEEHKFRNNSLVIEHSCYPYCVDTDRICDFCGKEGDLSPVDVYQDYIENRCQSCIVNTTMEVEDLK